MVSHFASRACAAHLQHRYLRLRPAQTATNRIFYPDPDRRLRASQIRKICGRSCPLPPAALGRRFASMPVPRRSHQRAACWKRTIIPSCRKSRGRSVKIRFAKRVRPAIHPRALVGAVRANSSPSAAAMVKPTRSPISIPTGSIFSTKQAHTGETIVRLVERQRGRAGTPKRASKGR